MIIVLIQDEPVVETENVLPPPAEEEEDVEEEEDEEDACMSVTQLLRHSGGQHYICCFNFRRIKFYLQFLLTVSGNFRG